MSVIRSSGLSVSTERRTRLSLMPTSTVPKSQALKWRLRGHSSKLLLFLPQLHIRLKRQFNGAQLSSDKRHSRAAGEYCRPLPWGYAGQYHCYDRSSPDKLHHPLDPHGAGRLSRRGPQPPAALIESARSQIDSHDPNLSRITKIGSTKSKNAKPPRLCGIFFSYFLEP